MVTWLAHFNFRIEKSKSQFPLKLYLFKNLVLLKVSFCISPANLHENFRKKYSIFLNIRKKISGLHSLTVVLILLLKSNKHASQTANKLHILSHFQVVGNSFRHRLGSKKMKWGSPPVRSFRENLDKVPVAPALEDSAVHQLSSLQTMQRHDVLLHFPNRTW